MVYFIKLGTNLRIQVTLVNNKSSKVVSHKNSNNQAVYNQDKGFVNENEAKTFRPNTSLKPPPQDAILFVLQQPLKHPADVRLP